LSAPSSGAASRWHCCPAKSSIDLADVPLSRSHGPTSPAGARRPGQHGPSQGWRGLILAYPIYTGAARQGRRPSDALLTPGQPLPSLETDHGGAGRSPAGPACSYNHLIVSLEKTSMATIHWTHASEAACAQADIDHQLIL